MYPEKYIKVTRVYRNNWKTSHPIGSSSGHRIESISPFLKILFNPRKQCNEEIIAIFGVISPMHKHFARKDLDTSLDKFLL